MRSSVSFIWIIVIAVLFSPSLSFADKDLNEPLIEGLRLRQGEEHVLLSANLVTDFDEGAREALRGGVPLTFRFKIRLTYKGSVLREKRVRSEELVHTLQYNPVKQFYHFIGEGYPSNVEATTRDEDEALKMLMGIVDWPLYRLTDLRKDQRYRVRVMATLRSAELPSVLGYLFFFTTIFNKETTWAQLDFTY